MNNKKIGFCFSGEGARGAIQAGIALALSQQGIKADFTIGVSSGSCCAAAYAFGGPEGLAKMWQDVRWIFSVFGLNWNFLWNRGILNQKPSEKIISKMIKNDKICEGVVSRLHIETGEVQYISTNECTKEYFAEAALGSFAISALVQDRNGWVDAGSRVMTPLKQCIDADCTEIYVILGRPLNFLDGWKLPKGFLSSAKMAYRALDLSLFELMMRDIKSCLKKNGEPGFRNIPIKIIQPKELLYESVEFRKCKMGVQYGLEEWDILEERAFISK
jgi:predicted acylesterase/phospholipase RssA